MVKERWVAVTAIWVAIAVFGVWDVAHENWKLVFVLELPLLVILTAWIFFFSAARIRR